MKLDKALLNHGKPGFSLVELIIVIGIISTFSGIIVGNSLNWIRAEKVNSYTRQLREYLRIVRLHARRWGTNCYINTNSIGYNSVPSDKDYFGYSVSCEEAYDPNIPANQTSKIGSIVPPINNSIFQVISKNFEVTPNGRISSDKAIVIVIGSAYHNSGPKTLKCLVIKTPTGQIRKGNFITSYWISSNMAVSQLLPGDILVPNNCISS